MFDRPFSCQVERWANIDSGALKAPTRNERATHVGAGSEATADRWAHRRQVRTLASVHRSGMFEIDFPIDIVYMWVNGADPDWQLRKLAALVAGTEPVEECGR